ncbi:MAG: hypothetical protein ABII13_01165 [Patescibacteria group bacterium]
MKEEKTNWPEEPLEWLAKFATKVASGAGPTALAHRFVQMGVADPEEPNEFPEDQLFDWLYANQSKYNAAVREILDSQLGLREKIRRVLQRDLRGPDKVLGSDVYGKIVLKSDGQKVLKHFLAAKPDPAWVG